MGKKQRLFFMRLSAIFAFLIVFIGACQPKLDEPRWDADVLAPLLHGQLGLGDMANDSILQTRPDGTMLLVIQQKLFEVNLADQDLNIPDTFFLKKITVDSIRLSNQVIEHPISFGQTLSLAGYDPKSFHNVKLAFPAINNVSSGTPIPIDASEFFETATLKQGWLDLTIRNGYPVDLTDVILEMRNAVAGDVVLRDTFPLIKKGETVAESYDLAGRTVEGQLEADLVDLNSPGSTDPVLVDTGKILLITMSTRDMTVTSAKAVFPAQDLIYDEADIDYDLGGPEITKMVLREGRIEVEATNTIDDSLRTVFALPGAIDSLGRPMRFEVVVPPAPPGGSVTLTRIFDATGATIPLQGQSGVGVNKFFQVFQARLDSTGNLVHISSDDSVVVRYRILDMKPAQAFGYLGEHLVDVGPSVATIDWFQKVIAGTIDLETAKLVLRIRNTIGMDADVRISSLVANPGMASNTALDAPFIQQNIQLKRAFLNPREDGLTSLVMDPGNSNVKAFLEAIPKEISYAVQVHANPKGNAMNYQDFADIDHPMVGTMDLEVPLSVSAQGITLRDTLPFSFGRVDAIDDISKATLHLLTENEYPMLARIQVELFSGDEKLFDLFQTPALVEGAEPVGPDCFVETAASSKSSADLSGAKLPLLFQADRAVITVSLNSRVNGSCPGPVRLLDRYRLGYTLTSSFRYDVR